MHYLCKNCKYEFDYLPPVHQHRMAFGKFGGDKCIICRRGQALERVCPKCGEKSFEISVKIPKEFI